MITQGDQAWLNSIKAPHIHQQQRRGNRMSIVYRLPLALCLYGILSHHAAHAQSSLPTDPIFEICDWCSSNQDFRNFAEAKSATRPPGSNEYFIGNPFSETLVRVMVIAHPNQPPLSFVSPAPIALTQDFEAVSHLAKEEIIVVMPPNACAHCGSYSDSIGEPDFYGWLYQNHAEEIISSLKTRNTPIVYLVKSFFFGKHATLVVVYPNGDTVKVDIISKILTPGALSIQEGSAVDADGNALNGTGDTGHYGGGGALPGFFNLRIERPIGWTTRVQWYACGPDGEGGYVCEKIPPPGDDNFPSN